VTLLRNIHRCPRRFVSRHSFVTLLLRSVFLLNGNGLWHAGWAGLVGIRDVFPWDVTPDYHYLNVKTS